MKNSSPFKILVQNTKWIYISKIATQILNLISVVLVIRKLDVNVFGTYSLLLNSFVVFQVFALSSIQNVFNRYIPELIANNEYLKFKKLIRSGFFFSSLFFTLLILLLYLNKDTFASFFNIENFDKYLLAFFIFNFSNFFKILIDTALKSLLLHKKVAIITIINTTLRTLLYIVFIDKLDVNLLLYIEITLACLFILQGFYIYYKYIIHCDESIVPQTQTPVTFKRVRKYGLLSVINELGVGIVGKKSDYFIIAALSSPYYVGLFAFAHKIYGMVYKMLPFNDFQTVLRPLFFKKYVKEYKIGDFRNMYAFMIKMLLPLYVLPGIFFFFLGAIS